MVGPPAARRLLVDLAKGQRLQADSGGPGWPSTGMVPTNAAHGTIRWEGPMDPEQGFLQALADHPEDATTRLVYADWLEERQDPRSEYLRLLVALITFRSRHLPGCRPEWRRQLHEGLSGDEYHRLLAESRRITTRLQELGLEIDPDWRRAIRVGVYGPRLRVLRGQKLNVEYPLLEGANIIGRTDEKPVDIDLEDQHPPDMIWCSRQHACVTRETDRLAIEDTNSASGTWLNRARVLAGQQCPLQDGDMISIGRVQLRVVW
jgi:uncharacterized protein (TIGR02996 family)